MPTTTDDFIIAILCYLYIQLKERKNAPAEQSLEELEYEQRQTQPKLKRQRRWWVPPWLTNERRQNTGQFYQLLQRELLANAIGDFQRSRREDHPDH